jgi:transcriptional regulator with XRE-family HTH domain
MRTSGKTLRLSEQLRRAIKASGLSRYRIAQLASIDQASLSKFMSGDRGLSFKAIDRLGDVLGLQFVARPHARRNQMKERG